MKTSTKLITVAAALLMGYAGAKGQTILSGSGGNSCVTPAGLGSGAYNTVIGCAAGSSSMTGGNNTLIGTDAGFSITSGADNTYVGSGTAVGSTTGNNNSGFGTAALDHNTGDYGCAFGAYALWNYNSVSYNNAFGAYSLYNNTTGTPNGAFGYLSLYTNSSGTNNNAFGYKSLYNNSTGNYNTGFGDQTLYNTTASNNSALGYLAGTTNTTGSNNTLVGYSADVSSSGLTNATAVGANAKVYSSNSIELGDNNTAVSIGYSGSALTSQTKLDLLYSTGSAFSSGPVYGSHFINSNTISGSTTPYVYGSYAAANGTESNSGVYHYGVSASATNAYNCVGVSGVANSGSISGTRVYGGYFNAGMTSGGSITYGVYAIASGAGDNYALYANATGATGFNYAGFFNGDVYVNGGTNSGTGYLVASDRRFKTKINLVSNPTDIFKKLKPSSYYYDTTANNGMRFSGKKQYGFIAQELEEVLPELVYNVRKPAEYDKDGKVIHEAISHKAVNYDGFIALLTAELQTQQAKNDKQDSIIATMQKQINQLLAASGANNNAAAATAIQNITISDADVVVLNQNQPNPFAEQTIITYNIPANANSAQILFYDVNGKQINSVTITTKGKGALNVYANDLSNGMYSYTLVIDGKVIDTKKMVKQQ